MAAAAAVGGTSTSGGNMQPFLQALFRRFVERCSQLLLLKRLLLLLLSF